MSSIQVQAYKAVLKKKEALIISQYINKNFGIKLPEHKRIMLQGRLINRLVKLNFLSFEEYTNYVFSEEGEKKELHHMIDAISTNKTEFYREAVHFDYLSNAVIPEFIKAKESSTLNIWSAACSSGEEVYTIAMEVDNKLSLHPDLDFKILGTDISTRMLARAQKAIYLSSDVDSVDIKFKQRYLLKSKDSDVNTVRIQKHLRDKTRFLWHNVMDSQYQMKEDFDIIFCRNLLIYFSKQDQKHVLLNMIKKLKPGGYLFLGHSESITHFNLPLRHVSQTVFQKI